LSGFWSVFFFFVEGHQLAGVMMKTRSLQARSLHKIAGCLFVIFSVALLSIGSGCNKKNPVTYTDNPPNGQWSLLLRGPQIVYRGSEGHVDNFDSIRVRVYKPDGSIADGILVHSQCDVSRDSVAALVTTRSDTVTYWRGCTPGLIYWGAGSSDGGEVIRSWAAVQVSPTHMDTITASYGFKIRNHP
jgi:hypothetical protein